MSDEVQQIYNKFLRLYEKLAEEREVITQQGIVLGKIIDALDTETKLATEFKVQMRTGLKENIRQATEAMGNDVHNAIRKNITDDVSSAVAGLKTAVKQSTGELNEYLTVKGNYIWYFSAGALLAAVMVGVIVAKWLMPFPLSDRQFELSGEGQRYEAFWDSISKKERDHLSALADRQIPPDENSIMWIIKKNPNLKADKVLKKFQELN